MLVYIGGKFGIENVYGRSLPCSNVGTNRTHSYVEGPSYGGVVDYPYIEPTTINVSGNTGGT